MGTGYLLARFGANTPVFGSRTAGMCVLCTLWRWIRQPDLRREKKKSDVSSFSGCEGEGSVIWANLRGSF